MTTIAKLIKIDREVRKKVGPNMYKCSALFHCKTSTLDRKLGLTKMPLTVAGKRIGPIGFGMIGLVAPGKAKSKEEAFAVMKAALNAGANMWNAGAFYGAPQWNSLHLLAAYFTIYPEDACKVFTSVKACFDRAAGKTACDAEG